MADEIFGLDIAQLVWDELQAAGGLQAGTLRKFPSTGSRDPDNLTQFNRGTPDEYGFQGVVAAREIRRPDTLIRETILVLTIPSRSIQGGAVPEVNDEAQIGSIIYNLVQLRSLDPAKAVYEFEVQ